MSQEIQPQAQPQDSQSLPSEETAPVQQGPDRNAAAAAKVQALRDAARAKMVEAFRQSQGVAPVPQAAEQAPIAEQKPVTPATPATPADPQAIAQAFTAQLNQQFREAERVRQEAMAQAQAAQKRAQEAEAQLQAFKANPAAYLQQEGLNIDEWNARLANGGEPTPEEKRLAAETAKWEAKAKALETQVTQVTQRFDADQQARAVAELQPVLAKDFPLVNEEYGPQAVIQALREQVARTGKQFTSPEQTIAAIAEVEAQLEAKLRARLQKPAVATKLGVSVQSPQAVVADQSPQTLTNRVTSAVAPSTSRPRTESDLKARTQQLIKKLHAEGRL